MYLRVRSNLAQDVRDIVDQELERAGDVFTVGGVAARVVARLRDEAPELLAKFLDEHAEPIVSRMIGDITRAQRAQVKVKSGRSVFSQALERYEQGEPSALAAWLDTAYVVTTKDERKRLRDMDKDDLVFAAHEYTDRARTNALQAAFLRSLADRVGARTVGEVFTDDELARMWNSLT
ncbi:MAG TPA: hypothetical protein VIV15_13450 [Anaerolineales bacterium]